MLSKAQNTVIALSALIAVTMLVDFSLFRQVHAEEVVAINTTSEKYYNAGGNSHYSFRLQTKHYNFPVSKHFAAQAQAGESLTVEVSPLFGEVNAYELNASAVKETYSLRTFSGLVLPVVVLLIFALAYKYSNKLSTLIFIAELSTLANLVYLLN